MYHSPLAVLLSNTSRSNTPLRSSGLLRRNDQSFQSKLNAWLSKNFDSHPWFALACRVLSTGSMVSTSKIRTGLCCLILLANSLAIKSIQVALSLQLSSTTVARACPSTIQAINKTMAVILNTECHNTSTLITIPYVGHESLIRSTCIGGLFVNGS